MVGSGVSSGEVVITISFGLGEVEISWREHSSGLVIQQIRYWKAFGTDGLEECFLC